MSVYAPGTSQFYGGGSSYGPSTELLRMQQMNINMEILTGANPWLAEDPQTLLELAGSGLDPEELANNAGAMAGIENLDRMAQNLQNLDPIAQRSVYSGLTEQQQRGLQEMGFQPNMQDIFEGSFLTGTPLEGVANAAGDVLGTVTNTAMKPMSHTVAPVLGTAFNAMAWLSDVPAHFYRAIRQMEGWQQWVALGGAALMAAVAAPIVAGGAAGMGTLMLAGGIGGAALAGGVLATAPTAISNRTEWWDMMNPWGATGVRRGERIFTKGAQQQSRQILGGADHIDAVARDIAANMDAYDFAQEFAGVMDAGNFNVMTSSIERVARGMADEGTEEYRIIFKGLSDLVELPEFRQAVGALQDGKISFGQDVAGAMGIDHGDWGHGMLSGALDAAWLLTMDPLMAVGKVGKLARMTRRGMAYDFSPEATARISTIIDENRQVGHAVDQLAKGMNDDNFELIPVAWRRMHQPIQEWMRKNGKTTFDRADFKEFIDDGHNFGAIMAGVGNVKGLEQIVLSGTNRSQGWGKFMHSIRRFQEGMTDEVYEATIRREAKKHGDDVARKLDHDFPGDYHEQAMDLTWQPVKAHPLTDPKVDAYAVGAASGKVMALVPGGRSLGRFVGSISTMTPANKMIMLTGDQAIEDIPRFVETMGRHFSMNSATRKAWLNEIMAKGSVAQRRQVTYSFMNNLFEVGGMNSTDAGRELAARYMTKYKQAFGQGGQDLFEAGGLSRNIGFMPDVHQADALLVPNLREMSKISRHGIMLKQVARLTDSELLEGMMSRYIKPGWLLRIGFIPRNAGEEMLAFFVRMTEGGIGAEFAARHIGTRNVWDDLARKLENAGGDLSKLTPDELTVWQRDTVPTYMKPLAAIGRRTGWQQMDEMVLRDRSRWLQSRLESGFVDFSPSKNMPQWKRDLLLGRKNSLRSLLIEGADPTLVKAGELWTMRHSDAIMKSVSSLNASVFERAQMNPNSVTMQLPNKDGVVEDVAVVMRGERGKIKFNDMRYAGALHHQMTEWLGDEKIAGVLADFATRLWTHGDGFLGKANVVEALQMSRKVDGFAHRTLLAEMLDWRPDNVAAAADKFQNFPEFAAGLRAAARSTDDDKLSVIIREMQDHAYSNAPIHSEITYDLAGKSALIESNERLDMVSALGDQFEELRPLYEGLDALSDSERAWVAGLISRDQAKPLDIRALEAWRDGENAAPRQIFYRGTGDGVQMVENPDGSLTLIPTKQTHLGARKGVSMSIDPYQSGTYTRGPATGSIDIQTGTLFEFDAEYIMAMNNTNMDELSAGARNYETSNPAEEAGLGMWGHQDEAATEVTWLSDEPVTIPRGKWRAQNRDEMNELRFQGATKAKDNKHAAELANKMSPHVGGYEIEDIVTAVKEPLESFIINMPPEQHALFVDLLKTDAMEWQAYHAASLTDNPLPKPEGLFDFAPFDYPLDAVDQGSPDAYAALNKYIDDWLDAGEQPIRPMLEALEDRTGDLADYFREQLNLPTVASLDPLQKVSDGFRQDPRSSLRQIVETDFSKRGKGAFAGEVDGWSPMFDNMEDWEKALENEIYETLARPENADAVRRSDHMLQGPNGQPVARPPEEGVARLYQPVVPRDIGHLDNLLTSTRYQPTMEKEVQESLTSLARFLDNPRLPKSQAGLWGEIQYLENTQIDGLAHGEHPINKQAKKVADQIRNGRSNADVQRALQAGEQITANPAVYEGAERTLTVSTRQKQWDDVAAEMIRTPRSIAFVDDTVHAMSEDEKIAIVSRALRQINSNKAYYSQPMETTLEQMAFDSPSIARWLSSILSDGPLDEVANARVGQIDVARKAIQSNGEWSEGVRLASVDNQTGVGRFWQLDDSHRGGSTPVDASTVHWFGRGEHKALGSGRMVEHGNFVVGDGYDAALRNWSQKIRENWVTIQRRGVKEAVTVKADGVARMGLDGYEPLQIGDRLELAEDYYEIDAAGRIGNPIEVGDTRYFEHEVYEKQDDLMWNVLSPAARDHWETISGDTTKVVRRIPKKGKAIKAGEKITDRNLGGENIVTMTRSRLDDVAKEGDAVPNLTVAKNFDRVVDTRWDRMVRYGFNKVIGPVMDGISRKPMSFHYFATAYDQHMRALPWMLDTQLFRNAVPQEFGDLLHLFAGETNLTDSERMAVRTLAKVLGDDLDDVVDPSDLKQYLLSLGHGADEIQQVLIDTQKSLRGRAVRAVQENSPTYKTDQAEGIIEGEEFGDFVKGVDDVVENDNVGYLADQADGVIRGEEFGDYDARLMDERPPADTDPALGHYPGEEFGDYTNKLDPDEVGDYDPTKYHSNGTVRDPGTAGTRWADQADGVVDGEELGDFVIKPDAITTRKKVTRTEYESETVGFDITGTTEGRQADEIQVLIDSTNFDLLRYGIDSPGLGASNSERLVEFYHDLVPDELWEEGAVAVKTYLADQPGVFSDFTPDQWRVLHAARGNLKRTMELAEDTASIRAMENVLPFLDSHEQRSMMAEYGRNFIPFWYAQENFIKRWARTFSTSPVWGADQLRKMQLTYMGLKSAAVIRTDPNGKDWVVYPGSGLLVEAVSAIPGMDHKPIGVLFQASTDSMLPGIESDLGSSSLSPFAAMPVHVVSHFFPETANMKRNLLGDIGANRSIMSQFVPGVLQNVWTAAFENEDSSARHASAMMTAIAMSEAEGNGLKEGATAYEIEEYLDEMRNHARVILFAQAIAGYVSPGAPSSIATGEDVGSFGWLTGMGIESPGMLASTTYRTYLSNLGPEEGTQAFLAAFPKADLEDVVNPLAFTQPGSESISKAPLPATEKGMSWYRENKGWIDSSPEAGAWFLPTDDSAADFDYYAYSQQFSNGLRKRKAPAEFITSIKYRAGADVYFTEKEKYEEQQERIGKENADGLAQAKVLWDNWKAEFMTANPIFAEEIQSGDSRVRRARTIKQLRYAANDPAAPPSPHMDGIREIVEEWDKYQASLLTYKYDRSAGGQESKRRIKAAFEEWANNWKRDNPQLDRLWSSVYRPEANLES